MKDFFELREATTGRDGVKCSGEKSQFGGYRAVCKRGSKGVYASSTSYKDAATAKKHAEVYADTYYSQGDRAAQRATSEFEKKNASKLFKESVDESLSAMIKKKHDKTKKDQEDAKKNMALKSRLKKSGIHVKEESVEEGKLPPHLAKFFDKDGNLNKDAEERVKKGRKAKGLDPYTGKKLKEESVDEGRYLSPAEKKFRDQERNAGLEDEGGPSYSNKKLILHKNGKPLKIGGKEVVVKDKNHAQGIVNKLMKQPFNKDAKFSMVSVDK